MQTLTDQLLFIFIRILYKVLIVLIVKIPTLDGSRPSIVLSPPMAFLPLAHRCYDPDTFHFFFLMTHYLTRAGTPMTHPDSGLMTHYLPIVPYDIITDVTMTHADSCLLTTYVIMTHS